MQSHNPAAVLTPRPWHRVASALPRPLPLSFPRFTVPVPHNIEVSRLKRYVLIAALFGLMALLHAWARIDLRETAVALDQAEREYAAAQGEQARLQLELASLQDPTRLERLGASLSLDRTVPVVTLAAPKPAEVASR